MNEDWKNRMYEFEVNPPVRVWEKITAALKESHMDDQFPAMLHEMEVKPPASAWKAIAANLDEQSPVVKYRRISPVLRYAAAAIVLMFIAWGGLRFFKSGRSANNDLPVVKTETPASIINENPPTIPPQEEEELLDEQALEQSKQTYASLGLTSRNRNRLNEYAYFVSPVSAELVTVETSPETTYRELSYLELPAGVTVQDPLTNNLASRYIMLMTPEGNIIRMSKKLSELVCCVSGEELDEDCKSRLNKWRSRIASSPSHPGNFMDILQLVNSLQSLK